MTDSNERLLHEILGVVADFSGETTPTEEIKMLRLHGELASIVRVHVVRLTVAFGVSFLEREGEEWGVKQRLKK